MRNNLSACLYAVVTLCAAVVPFLFFNSAIFIRVGTTVLLGCGLFFVGYFVRYSRGSKPQVSFMFTLPDVAVVVLFLYYLLRYVFTPVERIMPERFVLQLTWFISYGFIRFRLQREKLKAVQVLYVVLVFGVFQAILAILQWFQVLPNLFPDYRMGGVFGNPGDLANVLVLVYATALGLALESKQHKGWFVAAGAVILLAILLANARTAWVAVLGVSILMGRKYLRKQYWWLRKKLPSYVFAIGILSVLALGLVVAVQLYQYKQASSEGRLFIWQRCQELIEQRPLLGHGYDSFVRVYPKMQIAYFEAHPDDFKNGLLASNILFAYNDYLQLAIEYGLLGLGLWLGLLSMVFLPKVKWLNSSFYPLTIQGMVAGLLFCMLFSYPMENYVIPFVLMMALALYATGIPVTVCELRLKHLLGRLAVTVAIVLSILVVAVAGVGIHYAMKWKYAYERFESGDKSALEDYIDIFSVLRYDKYFCYNYGSALYNSYRFEECIVFLEAYKDHFYDSDLLMILAESYTMINDFTQAERYLKKAANLKPHQFEPKYKLFLLYRRNNRSAKAVQMAETIKYMPVKVYSDKVKQFKTEANAYLSSSLKNK